MVFIGNQPTAVPLTSSQLTDGLITSAKIADGAVINVDVNSTAAIAYSKLNLATSIVNADISASAAIATTKLGAGAVLQVVNVTYSTNVTSSSSTFADTGLTASITPSSASNKILIFVNCNGVDKFSGNTGSAFKLVRGATNIHNIESVGSYTNNSDENAIGSVSTCYLDSPSTTSSTTYKITFSNFNNTGVVAINGNSVGGGTVSTMLLMEIAG